MQMYKGVQLNSKALPPPKLVFFESNPGKIAYKNMENKGENACSCHFSFSNNAFNYSKDKTNCLRSSIIYFLSSAHALFLSKAKHWIRQV